MEQVTALLMKRLLRQSTTLLRQCEIQPNLRQLNKDLEFNLTLDKDYLTTKQHSCPYRDYEYVILQSPERLKMSSFEESPEESSLTKAYDKHVIHITSSFD